MYKQIANLEQIQLQQQKSQIELLERNEKKFKLIQVEWINLLGVACEQRDNAIAKLIGKNDD